MTDVLRFGATGWFTLGGLPVASVRGIPEFDPRSLLGQHVIIDDTAYRVRRVEVPAILDPTGTDFALQVEPCGI